MSKKRNFYVFTLHTVSVLCALFVISIVIFMTGYVFIKGITHITWEFVFREPSYLENRIGILPNILNTLYIVISTLGIVMPIGVGAAVYLTEYASNKTIVAIIEYATEILSGIPSIIYGLIGMLIFSDNFGTCLLAGALTLSIMNLPTVIRVTQESLKTVPVGYREGAFALGAGKWCVIRSIVIPECIEGMVTGCILTVGKVLGESAALLFTAGFVHSVNNIFTAMLRPGATLSVALYIYAKEDGEFGVAFAIAAILIVLTFLLNLSAELVGKYFIKRRNS